MDKNVNWSKMVWDLRLQGLHVSVIAKNVHVSRATIIRWRDYKREPLWSAGNRLIKYWAKTTGGNPDSLPLL